MAAICTILRRELGAYFNTPIAYVVIFVYLVISGAFYVHFGFSSQAGDLRAFFEWQPLVMALLIPALTMRLWSEERQLGTLELLMTLPVRTWQAVAGKFLAATAFLVVMLLFTMHLPIFLGFFSNPPGPDWGTVVGGYLGCLAMGMMYIAIGLFASSLTRDQIVALIIGLAICILLWLIGFPVFVSMIREFSAEVAVWVQNFSIVPHFESISRGVLDTRDLVYVVSVGGFFLLLTNLVMERRR
jgi:ABC-2 type transport system permease protein